MEPRTKFLHEGDRTTLGLFTRAQKPPLFGSPALSGKDLTYKDRELLPDPLRIAKQDFDGDGIPDQLEATAGSGSG